MDYIKVKGHDHLIRDPKTNAIINTNMSEYNEYLSRRDSKLKDNQKARILDAELLNKHVPLVGRKTVRSQEETYQFLINKKY